MQTVSYANALERMADATNSLSSTIWHAVYPIKVIAISLDAGTGKGWVLKNDGTLYFTSNATTTSPVWKGIPTP